MKIACQHWSACGVKGGGCCALGKFGGRPSAGLCATCLGIAKPAPTPPAKGVANTFAELWGEIHDPARSWSPDFIQSIANRLPCGDCRDHFRAYVAANPPPIGDDVACHAWGIALHNAVNARLGKPVFSPARLNRTLPD